MLDLTDSNVWQLTYSQLFVAANQTTDGNYSKLRDIHQGGLGKYWSFVHIDWRAKLARWAG